MTFQDDLLRAFQELISTDTEDEAWKVLTLHPELLTGESIIAISDLCPELYQDTPVEYARAREMTEWLIDIRERIAAYAAAKAENGLPKLAVQEAQDSWTFLIRKYLALRDTAYIEQAIQAAQAANESEIVEILKKFPPQDLTTLEHINAISDESTKKGLYCKAMTLRLLYIDYFALQTELYVHQPPDQQAQMLTQGIEICYEAIDLAEQLDDDPCQAFYTIIQGLGYRAVGDFHKLCASYREGLRIYHSLTKKAPENYLRLRIKIGNDYGIILHDLGLFPEAERVIRETIEICRPPEGEESEIYRIETARQLLYLGRVLTAMRRLHEAEQVFRKSLDEFRNLTPKGLSTVKMYLANSLNNLGIVYWLMRRLSEAEELFLESLEIKYELRDIDRSDENEAEVAQTLTNFGLVLWHLRRLDEAEKIQRKAISTFRTLAAKDWEKYAYDKARSISNLGAVLLDKKQLKEAEDVCIEALREYELLAQNFSEMYQHDIALTMNNLGAVLREQNKPKEAEEIYLRALQIRWDLAENDPLANKADLALTMINLGLALSELRRFQEAAKLFVEALHIYTELSDSDSQTHLFGVGISLSGVGKIYVEMGRFDLAEPFCRKALEVFRDLSETDKYAYRFDIASALDALASVLYKRHFYEEAAEYRDEALDIWKKLVEADGDTYQYHLAISLGNSGLIFSELKKFERSLDAFGKALEILRRLAVVDTKIYQPKVAFILNNFGATLIEMGDKLDEAEATYLEAKEICEGIGDIDFLMIKPMIYSGLGQVKMAQGKWEKASFLLEQGINCSENLYSESYNAERARQIMEENFALYENQVVCRMKLNDKISAFNVAEKGKARSLNDLLRQQASRRINSETAYKAFDESLNFQEAIDLAKDSRRILIMFRVTNYGTYIFLVFPTGKTDVITVNEFNSEKLNKLLVDFDENNQTTGGWGVNYYSFLRAYANRMEAANIYNANPTDENAETFIKSEGDFEAAKKDWLSEMDRVLHELYKELMQDVHNYLEDQNVPGGSQIVIIPNRGLGILPLHACWWQEKGHRSYLIDKYTFIYSPSLTILKKCWAKERNKNSDDTLLAISNPTGDLKGSEKECEAIVKLFGSDRALILHSSKALKSLVKEECQQKTLLHFSCHGIYNLDEPYESGLLLAAEKQINEYPLDDGKLRFMEIIEDLNLNHTWLTVLSACETALTEPRALADEYYSITTAFLIAGSQTVWGTLWSVEDESTKKLLVKAYYFLNKKSKPEALREAQLYLKRQPQYSHPVYWAAMQSFGV